MATQLKPSEIKPIIIETYPNKPYGPETKLYNIIKIECILQQIHIDDLCAKVGISRRQLRYFLNSNTPRAIKCKLDLAYRLKIDNRWLLK